MRVTTQMLNRAAQKAGIPVNRTSLLNYINGNGSDLSMANAVSKTQKNTDAAKRSEYEKVEKSAGQLLSSGGEELKASDLQNFVDRYNEMLKSLKKAEDNLDKFYAQSARNLVKENQQELAKYGITVEKDGTLSFDKAKFEKFSAEQSAKSESGEVKEADSAKTQTGEETEETAAKQDALFDNENGFFSRLKFLASLVSDSAGANVESFSGYYNGAGVMTNAYSNGKYNFWS